MTMKKTVALALGAALLLGTAPLAFADDAHPTTLEAAPTTSSSATPMTEANGIVYVTGGIGDDEREAIEATRADYNLHITNSNKEGAFNDSTQLTISDSKGNVVLSAEAGPLFFVQLPAGSYTIFARHRDREQPKKIKVTKSKKPQPDLHFVW